MKANEEFSPPGHVCMQLRHCFCARKPVWPILEVTGTRTHTEAPKRQFPTAATSLWSLASSLPPEAPCPELEHHCTSLPTLSSARRQLNSVFTSTRYFRAPLGKAWGVPSLAAPLHSLLHPQHLLPSPSLSLPNTHCFRIRIDAGRLLCRAVLICVALLPWGC